MHNGNPWNKIPVKEYELHMSDMNIFQAQTLNMIMESQVNDYVPDTLAVFGVTSGNGLEHTEKINKVYAVDINEEYLDRCSKKFSSRKNITYVKLDIENDIFNFGKISLAICNLIFEYVNEEKFIKKISGILCENGILSIVFQKNENNSYISKSAYSDTFNILNEIHHDVDELATSDLMVRNGFSRIKKTEYNLPNAKKLVRLDFKK
jgi:ubiquinone/menaquinone biosynthesis C-methylase UbiE